MKVTFVFFGLVIASSLAIAQKNDRAEIPAAKSEGVAKRALKPFVPPKEINLEYAARPLQRAVDYDNYDFIREGWSYDKTVELLGQKGKELSAMYLAGVETVMYQWTARDGVGNITATFQNGKLVAKAQFGLK